MKIFRTLIDIILLLLMFYLLFHAICFAFGLYLTYDWLKAMQGTDFFNFINEMINMI